MNNIIYAILHDNSSSTLLIKMHLFFKSFQYLYGSLKLINVSIICDFIDSKCKTIFIKSIFPSAFHQWFLFCWWPNGSYKESERLIAHLRPYSFIKLDVLKNHTFSNKKGNRVRFLNCFNFLYTTYYLFVILK